MADIDSSDESVVDLECTPPHIKEAAKNVILNLLPDKSKTRYEREYTLFVQWCKTNQVKSSYSEDILLAYLSEISRTKKSSTIWSVYSMLKSTLSSKHNVDISKYSRLIAFLKKQSVGYRAKKSKVLRREEINRFLSDAPDECYLMLKVALIFGIFGACRRDELTKMLIHDIEDNGTIMVVKIPNTKTGVQRTFIVSKGGEHEVDYLGFCRKYVALRPSHATTQRLFLRYENGKCTNRVVGMNTFGNMPKRIAEFLNLPGCASYTGHCFRRTSATLLADAGADITSLKRHGGWKSTSVAEGYIEESLENKIAVSHKILGQNPEPAVVNNNVTSAKLHELGSGIQVQNCENCTINFKIVHNSSNDKSMSPSVMTRDHYNSSISRNH